MGISTKSIRDVTVVELSGEIDGKTAPQVQEEVLTCIKDKVKVILDMSDVSYLSSAGLRVLLMVYKQMKSAEGKVALVGLIDDIKEVMNNTGFINYFITANSINEGIKEIE